ncbi:MAG: hypothetical protein JST67_03510, partial [Bacteroidetes bacterium]|nr:hypothetical protein [Bacteroidota bacterium]
MNIIKKYSFLFLLLAGLALHAQERITLNSSIYMVIQGNANVVLDNPNTNGITTIGGGNIITEGELNVLKWNIGTNTGNYIVPFATWSLVNIPLSVNITSAGAGAGSVLFSTYKTATNLNTPYPSDVTNMNSSCNNGNALYAVDRFWRVDAQNYGTKPSPTIDFGYNPSPSEIGGSNTIVESKLRAERFNNSSNLWETPQKLFGHDNPVTHHVNNAVVTPADFYKSWTLIDTTIMNIPITVRDTTICSGTSATLTPSGGITYTLVPNNLTGTSFSVNPSGTTSYTVIGVNALGCVSWGIDNATPTVSVNPTPTVTATSPTICAGFSATATASGASTYTWSTGSNAASITQTPTLTTNYTVTGTNTFSCSATATTNIVVNPKPTMAASQSNVTCFSFSTGSATATATGGTAPYHYAWSNGQNNNQDTALIAGTYTCIVSDAQ